LAPGTGDAGGVDQAIGALSLLLGEAQRRGFVGPGPVGDHVAHAWPLVAVLPDEGLGVDLGSGGGVPALILAWARPRLRWVLVESQDRRARWLREALRRASMTGQVDVRRERAEAVARSDLRGRADVVTARSFAPPAVTAECGAPFLAVGGSLWVAEPPAPVPDRWDERGLDELGLRRCDGGLPGWAGFEQVRRCPERYPRRVGIPSKRPLF
jgi:16S rRNA (guanine527-N7)-methyltransferase